MTRTVTLSAIAAFTILAVWVIASGRGNPTRTPAPSGFESKEQSGGNVTVVVTPQELTRNKPATFQIIFDTHSVDLNFNVEAAAELRDEQGNTYGAAVWSGDPPGGHHRKGTLSFPTPIKKTSTVMLTLNDIAGVKERIFSWNL